MATNIYSLRERRGPDFDNWLRGLAQSVVGIARQTRDPEQG